MARNYDWSYGDSGGAEHDTTMGHKKEKHSTRMQLVRLTELTTAEVTDDVRCRGSDGIMARQRFECLVFLVGIPVFRKRPVWYDFEKDKNTSEKKAK